MVDIGDAIVGAAAASVVGAIAAFLRNPCATHCPWRVDKGALETQVKTLHSEVEKLRETLHRTNNEVAPLVGMSDELLKIAMREGDRHAQ